MCRHVRSLLQADRGRGAPVQNVSSGGLAPQEAAQRLERFGPNKLSEGKKKSVAAVFAEQFKDLLVVILIIAAIISAISENVESTIVIFAVLILNAVLGTVQYLKAEKSLESLKAMSSPHRQGPARRRAGGDPLGPGGARGHRAFGRRATWWWPTDGFCITTP